MAIIVAIPFTLLHTVFRRNPLELWHARDFVYIPILSVIKLVSRLIVHNEKKRDGAGCMIDRCNHLRMDVVDHIVFIARRRKYRGLIGRYH
jgi:hypothetical protein